MPVAVVCSSGSPCSDRHGDSDSGSGWPRQPEPDSADCIGSSLCSKLIPPTFGTSGTGTAVPAVPTVRYMIGLYD